MSCEYIFDAPITEDQLLSVKDTIGFEIDKTVEGAKDDYYPIAYEGSWIWIHVYGVERNIQATRFGMNSDDVLYRIADELNVSCWCEHDEQFSEILKRDNEGEHGEFVTLDLSQLDELATDIFTIDPTTGETKTIKKDGKKVN